MVFAEEGYLDGGEPYTKEEIELIEGDYMFIDDIKEIVCYKCDDKFCQKSKADILQCISRYKEAWDTN
jgi:hypothetical protein